MARFTAYVETKKVGSRCETDFDVDDEELERLTADERTDKVQAYALEAVWGLELVEVGFTEVGE
jgi:hypothetical protein